MIINLEDMKDKRSDYAERQEDLKDSDRNKGKSRMGSDRFHWKRHKGHATRSGRLDCMWRNYGRHDKNRAGPQFDIPELTIETVYRPPREDDTFEPAYYWFELDDRRDCISEEEALITTSRRPEVLLSDIVRPSRRRKGKEDDGFERLPGPSKVLVMPDESLWEPDLDQEDWIDICDESGLHPVATYAQAVSGGDQTATLNAHRNYIIRETDLR